MRIRAHTERGRDKHVHTKYRGSCTTNTAAPVIHSLLHTITQTTQLNARARSALRLYTTHLSSSNYLFLPLLPLWPPPAPAPPPTYSVRNIRIL